MLTTLTSFDVRQGASFDDYGYKFYMPTMGTMELYPMHNRFHKAFSIVFSPFIRHIGQVLSSVSNITMVQIPHARYANHENHYVMEHVGYRPWCTLCYFYKFWLTLLDSPKFLIAPSRMACDWHVP